MKIPVFILLVLITSQGFSQKKSYNFNVVDRKASQVQFTSPEELSRNLSSFCSNDLEKVRAFFIWIAENISYKVPDRSVRKKKQVYLYDTEEEDTGALKPLDVRVAEQVLKNKTAFCDGYSRLFKALCDFAGIRTEVVIGYARTNYGSNGTFRSNHTWNAVYIDSIWHLLDVTWASGFISMRSGEFVRYYDDYYFLTPPAEFIRDHYPDDIRWALLDKLPAIREFNRSPYRQQSFNKYPIVSFYPSEGIIEAFPGDTIRIVLETGIEPADRKVAPEPEWADSTLSVFASWAVAKAAYDLPGNKIVYTYAVPHNSPEWLHIVYNEDPVLRYRLNVKREKAALNK